GVGHWKRAEQECVDKAENGRVGANAQGECENGDSGESRRFAEHAKTETNVLKEILDKPHATNIAALLFLLLQTFDGAKGCAPGCFRLHAPPDVLVGRLV